MRWRCADDVLACWRADMLACSLMTCTQPAPVGHVGHANSCAHASPRCNACNARNRWRNSVTDTGASSWSHTPHHGTMRGTGGVAAQLMQARRLFNHADVAFVEMASDRGKLSILQVGRNAAADEPRSLFPFRGLFRFLSFSRSLSLSFSLSLCLSLCLPLSLSLPRALSCAFCGAKLRRTFIATCSRAPGSGCAWK